MSDSQPRYLALLFNGTWQNGEDDETFIPVLKTFFQGTNVLVQDFGGVGTLKGRVDKYIGGAIGAGLYKILASAFKWLSQNYRPGDIIIFIGYSRGAFTARSLASVISKIGLPKAANNKTIKSLLKAHRKGLLKDPEHVAMLRATHNTHPDVPISFLGAFDTVGSLGIPKTGILRVLKLSDPFIKRLEFHDTDMPTNVAYAFHALSLHERRAPFTPTLMHLSQTSTGQILVQTWYAGTHTDFGRSRLGARLMQYPIAGLLTHLLLAIPSLRLNEAGLKAFFPRFNMPTADFEAQGMQRRDTLLYQLLGQSVRAPGKYAREGFVTNEGVDRSVGLLEDSLAVGGVSLVPELVRRQDGDGRNEWANGDGSIAIKEGVRYAFQDALLGWS